MKVSILTLGCKVNQAESSMIEADLRTQGWNVVNLKENPDLCVINTCTVTARSDYQSRQLIRRAQRSGARVIVTGCYSELNGASVESLGDAVQVVANKNKSNIGKMLVGSDSSLTLDPGSSTKSRYFLKVQDGCNYSCSYCIIPKARGRSRSLKPQVIVERIAELSGTFSEVVLTGIHLGTYGYDLRPKVQLSTLLRDILLKTSLRRIRLSSLEITEMNDELLEIIRDYRIAKHLHAPLQSADDKILRAMNRNYTSREFVEGLHAIFRKIPGISISTDVIVGFPGEGETEFENTFRTIEELPLSYLHVFPYSPRPDTEAAKMRLHVDSAAKRDRAASLRALGERKKKGYMIRQIGRTLDLLIEDIGDDQRAFGITGNYLKARASLSRPRLRSIVPVSITGVEESVLVGYAIEDS